MPTASIENVLSASNHYEVLDIEPEEASDSAILRKAYLKRSVQVHPDKNDGDERATQAFQKVAQAYNVLSNDESRAKYERYGEEPVDNDSETYYAGASPSYQDAMFVFASVASMMGGPKASGVANAASAMYFAETFLNKEKVDLSDGKSKAQAAMVLGTSLRAVSSAVRTVGFTRSAAALNSAASVVQVAGIGAMVADTPAVKKALEEPSVKRTLESGSQKLAQLGGSLAAAREAIRKRGEQSNRNAHK